jgi:2-polyprenyl-6-methoxyphenol hydroxylase-like FAD-dependent oxidoreductase
MKVCIIGGGPSALFLAVLLKSRGTADEILVLEQNPKDATYGFGVALAESAIDKLNDAEPTSMKALQEKMYFIPSQVIENDKGAFTLDFAAKGGAITRLDILTVLEQRCRDLGIEVVHERRIDDLSEFDDYDVIVGADGANSVVRSSNESEFGTQRNTRGNYFVWWGCAHPKHESGLRFRSYKNSSIMIHYYAYTSEMWTVVGEVEEQCWFDLGMDKMTNAERKAMFEEAFDDVFEGRPMIENKSNWNQFEAIKNERWSVGNRVLIGDALYRAHFSIGSGTRLAMEDALGLADALAASPDDIPAALAAYEEKGKPKKEKLMAATVQSYTWYENVHEKLGMPVLDFIQDYMDRTGRMPADRLKMFVPNFVAAQEQQAS